MPHLDFGGIIYNQSYNVFKLFLSATLHEKCSDMEFFWSVLESIQYFP